MTAAAEARWRVAELAERAGVSVDTVRFYQKRGLLPPPERVGRVGWYGRAHEERLARIRDLQAQGFTLAVIHRLLDGELDPADLALVAAVDEADTGSEGAFLTLDEVADQAGVPVALVEAVAREGLLVARRHAGEARYTESDVAAVSAALALVEAGLPMPELFELARHHHRATTETAEAAVEMFDAHVRRPLLEMDLPAEVRAERLVAAFRVLLPSVTALVAHHFRRVLLDVAQSHIESVGDTVERAAVELEGTQLPEEWTG